METGEEPGIQGKDQQMKDAFNAYPATYKLLQPLHLSLC